MAKLSIQKILDFLEQKAPVKTAESWDNVGLLVGSQKDQTEGAVVAIDLTREVLDSAKNNGFKLIVNHHPCIFPKQKGMARVVEGKSDSIQNLIFEAVRDGISVVSCHTNFDQCALEVVEKVSNGLGVKPIGRLMDSTEGLLVKLVVFVPEAHAEAVRVAICQAGAGAIGNYDGCSFQTSGEGTFRGSKDTKPFQGTPGELERAKEVRLETVFPKGLQKQVLSALFEAHPYEEIAFDLYSLEQAPPQKGIQKGLGYGFYGDLEKELSFEEISKKIETLFSISGFMISEPRPQKIKRIAYAAGKGASFVSFAASKGCDLMITGEAGFHTAIDAQKRGMAVAELGHRESEKFYLSTMQEWMQSLGLKTEVISTALQSFASTRSLS